MQADNIFLIGFMGVGKSTIAKMLADWLGMELMEMDETIEKEQGCTINEIFAQKGEEGFRDMESALVERISQSKNAVVSCGGGAVLRTKNVANMKKNGKVIFLTAVPQTIFERVRYSTNRPLLNGNMNIEYIAGLMERRKDVYEAAADIVIHTDGKDEGTILKEVLEAVL
uniref:shikimate kinase n=1 Tax=Agathobacter sp. TaxID=2021311 RepID=UPI0040565C68